MPISGSGEILLRARDLSVTARTNGRARTLISGLNLTIEAGRAVALVGESGSGKSVSARSIVNLNPRTLASSFSLLEVCGKAFDPARSTEAEWRALRGSQVGYVLQDALLSLDPLRTIGQEVGESIEIHRTVPKRDIASTVLGLMAKVGIPNPEHRFHQRSDHLSGGLRQRALIASAISANPRLLIADEPTTALDVSVQAQVLELLEQRKQEGLGLLFISHDLAVVSQIAEYIIVLRNGAVVEEGPSDRILGAPEAEYTKKLLRAIPSASTRGRRLSDIPPMQGADRPQPAGQAPEGAAPREPWIRVDRLSKVYEAPRGVPDTVAVKEVSFVLYPGEIVGIVGESGSGKTTVGRMLVSLLDPDRGEIEMRLGGASDGAARLPTQIVSQDPMSSFDPRYTVGQIVGESLSSFALPASAVRRRVAQVLLEVGLDASFIDRMPRDLSGGQRQRVAIARALACEPHLIVCDEAVSALDVTIQAQILDLLSDIRDVHGTTILFISHDLGVIQHISDRILVMKDGEVVEAGEVGQVFERPQHAYTRKLIAALPSLVRS